MYSHVFVLSIYLLRKKKKKTIPWIFPHVNRTSKIIIICLLGTWIFEIYSIINDYYIEIYSEIRDNQNVIHSKMVDSLYIQLKLYAVNEQFEFRLFVVMFYQTKYFIRSIPHLYIDRDYIYIYVNDSTWVNLFTTPMFIILSKMFIISPRSIGCTKIVYCLWYYYCMTRAST